jgi:hypothetical protein
MKKLFILSFIILASSGCNIRIDDRSITGNQNAGFNSPGRDLSVLDKIPITEQPEPSQPLTRKKWKTPCEAALFEFQFGKINGEEYKKRCR